MTAQISDILHWNGDDYAITAVENPWPFEPEDVGLKPVMVSTGCWRGYHCIYEAWENRLLLREMFIGLGEEKPPEPLNGVKADRDELSGWHFKGLELPIGYSGGLLIGREFQTGYYVHMGFHRPHCYGRVYELFFESGILSGTRDHSQKMEEIRHSIRRRHEGPAPAKAPPEKEDLNRWIRDCFSLEYGVKKNWE